MAVALAGAGTAANGIIRTGGLLLPRVVPLAAGAVPAATGGALAGGFGAVALPLAASFAVGFAAGQELLRVWNFLNQALQQTPTPTTGDTATWPTPNAGQVVTYNWAWRSAGYGEPAVINRQFGTSVGGPPLVSRSDPDAYYPGFGQNFIRNFPYDTVYANGGVPGTFVLLSTSTSDGQPAVVPTTSSGYAPDRAPLAAAAGQPVGLKPATKPKAPARKAPVPTRREEPKAPPIPGTPAPAPKVPGPAPGGAPGKAPKGDPVGPGTQPKPITTPQRIGEPAKKPAPATMPTRDPERLPQTLPLPGTAPLPAPRPVPVTPSDLIRVGDLVIGQPAERPRPDLESIATELGRQEQKLAALLKRTGSPGGDATDLLGLAKQIYDALTGARPAGSYELYPPCAPATAEGPAPPDVAEWTASSGALLDLAKRIDALALLIQYHKDQGQPICKTAITGRPVTVNFISEPEV